MMNISVPRSSVGHFASGVRVGGTTQKNLATTHLQSQGACRRNYSGNKGLVRHRERGLSSFFDTDIDHMMRAMEKMVSPSAFLHIPDMFASNLERLNERSVTAWTPAVDISEENDKYLIHAELPGLSKENVKMEMSDGMLTISGERKWEHKEEDKEKRYNRLERQYGTFIRRFTIPKDVDQNNVKATFRDGVLNVILPRSAEKTITLEIKVDEEKGEHQEIKAEQKAKAGFKNEAPLTTPLS